MAARSAVAIVRTAHWLPRRSSRSALALLVGVIVAWAPRPVGAQAATPVQHTVRHTLRGDVGAVTRLALSSPWRPSEQERAEPTNQLSADDRRWMQSVDVRSNVRTVVVLEPEGSPAGDARNAWRVVDANGQLVPWQHEPVVLSHELPAGHHNIPIVWVAPSGVTSTPRPVVRLRIVSDAR